MHCQYILQISLLTLISLQVLSLKLNENGPVKKRDNVILACTSTCKLPQMEFLWFKDGRPLSGVPGGQYPLGPLSPNDTGCYSCALGQGISTPILLDVRYAPRDVSVKVSPSPEVVNGSRLTMTCSNNANPAAQTYIWFQRISPFNDGPGSILGSFPCHSSDCGAQHLHKKNWNRAEKKLPTKQVPQIQKSTLSTPEDIYENMRRSVKPITDPDDMNYAELNISPAPSPM
eukprot:XP_014012568.1 PREDICTED: B-cell receptor CD22-like isoform X3 [Salmo salar]